VNVSIERQIDEGEVLRFLEGVPEATFFHTPAWLHILTHSFDRFAEGWITIRNGSSLEGFMPFIEIGRGPFRTLWSLPFGTYGDPVATDRRLERELIDVFLGMASERRCLEAAAILSSVEHPLDGLPAGVVQRREECRIIELEETFQHYRSKLLSGKRRQLCNRAEEAGVVVRPIDDQGGVREFYGAYEAESAEWGGVHPYPYRFFEEILAHRDQGALILGAYLDDEFLGGHINFYFGDQAQAWQAGLTDRASSFEASAMLVVRAVEEAYRRGMKYFNLGSSDGNEGIIFFKESLGGREHIYQVVGTASRWYRFIRRR
jgi:hypothetical protein